MASEVFNLAILLSLKDMASGGMQKFATAAHRSLTQTEKDLRDLERELKKVGETSKRGIELKVKADKLREQIKNLKDLENSHESLREKMNRGMAVAGTGIAGMGLTWKGVRTAGDYQSSMTDLRTSLAEIGKDGKVSLDSLGKDMQKAETIAMRLGNALPGTTEDFIQMMQTLKQGGLETQTIFDGAAESVANLAVANKMIPADMAKDFAQFGQIYKLKAEEYKGVADIFSKIYTSKGVESGAIIESAKYFQGRAGNALGMTGLKGAEESVRLMAYLQKQGLESSQAGTSLSTFLVQASKNKKALEEIRKDYGITLDLFDKQGKFKGIENAVKELEKFKKLNQEQQLIALNKLGGEEGSLGATAIISGGVEGWKQFNSEVDKSISLQEKTAEKSKDFNNQLEALTGSLKNLVVTGFQPLLPSMTGGINKANEYVGALQDFAKAHPTLTATAGYTLAIGSAGLTAYGGIKTLYTGFKLLSLARSVAGGDGILNFLNNINSSSATATNSLANTAKQATSLKSSLAGIGGTIAVSVIVGYSLNKLAEFEQKGEEKAQLYKSGEDNFSAWNRQKSEMASKGLMPSRGDYDNQASLAWQNSMKAGLKEALPTDVLGEKFLSFNNFFESTVGKSMSKSLTDVFDPAGIARWTLGATNDFKGWTAPGAAEGFKKAAPQLADANIMASFIKQLPQNIKYQAERESVQAGIKEAYPESYAKAMEILGAESNRLAQTFAGISLQNGQNPLTFPGQRFNPFDLSGNKTALTGAVSPQNLNPQFFKDKTPYLSDPQMMANFRSRQLPQMGLGADMMQQINGMLKAAFPESFAQSSQILAEQQSQLAQNTSALNQGFTALNQQIAVQSQNTAAINEQGQIIQNFGQNLSSLQQPISQTQGNMQNLGNTANNVRPSLYSIISSANGASSALDSLSSKISSWQPPTPQIQTYNVGIPSAQSASPVGGYNPLKIGGYATGGRVLSKGLAYIHAGEDIVPASVTRRYEQPQTFSALFQLAQSSPKDFTRFEPVKPPVPETVNVHRVTSERTENRTSQIAPVINYSPTINVNGAKENTQTEFRSMLNDHSKELEMMIERAMRNGRERA